MHADSQEDDNGTPPKGYSLTFNTRESMLIFDITLNQYLGSVNSNINNIDNNSLFRVHKSEKKIAQFSVVHCRGPFNKCRSA